MLCNKKYFSKNDADLNAFVRRLKFLTDCFFRNEETVRIYVFSILFSSFYKNWENLMVLHLNFPKFLSFEDADEMHVFHQDFTF